MFQVFQEVTVGLPQEERQELMELIQSIQSSKPKRTSAKRWSGTIPQTNHRSKINHNAEPVQRYTPKEESAGIKIRDETVRRNSNRISSSLIGTCRAARIREDYSVFYLNDSIKINSLLKKQLYKFKINFSICVFYNTLNEINCTF